MAVSPGNQQRVPRCWGASRRGSQPVLGEGAVQASVPEQMLSKGSRGSVHWLEVEGWERPGGRPACAEPGRAGRRGQQCLGRLLGLAEWGCRGRGAVRGGAHLEGYLQGSGLLSWPPLGGCALGLGGARRKRSWECGAWRLCPAVTSLG